MALELGPLVIFFIVNTKGEDILAAFPVLSNWFTQPIIFAHRRVHGGDGRFRCSELADAEAGGGDAAGHRRRGADFRRPDALVAGRTFIKMKPTIVDSLFGAVLLGGLLFGQSLLKYVFGDVYKLKPEGWMVLTLRWGMFFFFLAVLNEVVWRTQSHRFLGGVQGLGDDATDRGIRRPAIAGADQVRTRSKVHRGHPAARSTALRASRLISWSLSTFSVSSSPVAEAIWRRQDVAIGGEQAVWRRCGRSLRPEAGRAAPRESLRGRTLRRRCRAANRCLTSVLSMSAASTPGSVTFSLNLKSSTLPMWWCCRSKTFMPT